MIRLLLKFMLFIFIISASILPIQSQQNYTVVKGERWPIDLKNITEDAYEKDRILIKFKHDITIENVLESQGKSISGFLGIPIIDSLNIQFKVKNVNRFFHQLVLGDKYTERHKAWGFHLWYVLTAESNGGLDIKEMVSKYKALDIIEVAEPVYKKHLIASANSEPFFSYIKTGEKGTKWTPNDPRYAEQWHYHNTGQQSGTPDKDIDLPEAWEIEKGNSNVIVAIIDGGIQYNHPDIQSNMWSGIGYNFVTNSSTIEPHSHGTHVAGTVAAVNNNGTGVAGIAGGSGSGDGIRLMSCQVFNATNSGGFHLAPVYAADNGASISQNSWGYTVVGVYNQAELDAIDYFNINGGGTSLTGGITIFAAGNNGSSGQWYPGCYSGAFSVAATNNNDQKAWYSNYDTWIDISAPGGETNLVGSRGVLSTLPDNGYGFNQGTSMACPHVSGVAALVVSLAYGQLNSADVANILQSSTNDHYPQNPSYLGKLGTGRLNAYQALLETQGYLSGILYPASFSANAISSDQIDLEWTKNLQNDNVMVVWSTSPSFGIPQQGTVYNIGDYIAGGGTVLYRGSGNQMSHTGLMPLTTYYYRAYSYTLDNYYSVGRPANSTTFCNIFQSFPFNESFEDNSLSRDCWTQEYVVNTNNWTYQTGSSGGSITTARSGQKNARFTSTSGGPHITKLVSPVLDFSGLSIIKLSFWYGQEFWSPDQNQLKLYYRISRNDPWIQIGDTYSSNISQWTKIENIILPNPSSTYQIAFEGIDNYGRANVIDDLEIISETPLPYADFFATPLTAFLNETITFTDASGNGIFDTWLWNFGLGADPATALGQGPHQVTYSTEGEKTVSLLVDGIYSKTKTNYITISEMIFAPPRNLHGSLVNNSDVELSWQSPVIQDDFEVYEDFSLDFGNYSVYDGDGSSTYGFDGISFANSGYTGSYIIFNPSETMPPITSPSIVPLSGEKFAACFAAVNPPNNDWLITPKIRLGTNESLRFFARSFVDTYGLERFKVGVSVTGNNPADFTIISSGPYISAPTSWTEYLFDLSAYEDQEIYIGINCISDDAFIFMLDDLSIGSNSKNQTQSNQIEKDLIHDKWQVNKKAKHENIRINNQAGDSKLFTNYLIYRNNLEIGSTNEFYFTDYNPGFGTHSYTVKAVYVNPDGLSNASNQADVIISEINCEPPTLLFANEVAQNYASLNWSPGGAEIQWQILYGISGFDPETEGILLPEVNINPFGLFDLLPETDYQFYVKSVCSGSSFSIWSNPGEFRTLGVLPEIFILSGGGTYCVINQPTGIGVQLSGSQTTVTYQLLNNGSAIGIPVTGTNGMIFWSNLTVGSYTIEATNASGSVLMDGVAEVIEQSPSLTSVTISESYNSVCQGTSVTYTAFPENGGSTPAYQWKVNGQNAGTNNSTFAYTPVDGDQVQVVMTSSLTCVTGNPATSNVISMTVSNSLAASVNITASQSSVCQGTSVTYTTFPENGGSTPAYQWKVNGQNAGTNNSTFAYTPADGDQVQVVMTSSLTCVTGNPATSNVISMTVSNSLAASVSITASQSSICQGISVTYTAFPENGGSTPAYQWKVNGQNAGTNNSTFAYTPVDSDQVQVVMTSSLTCVTGNPATSNVISMTVSNSLAASVSITASQSSVCQGTSVTYTAFPENGGSTPAYQWKVNGQNAGTNNSTFAYTPADGDQVQVVMTSSLTCVTGNPATSNTIEMVVNPAELSLIANPMQGGTVSYTGTPQMGQIVVLTAVPANGWVFVNWTNSIGEVISTNANFNFTITGCNHVITANFNTLNTITGKLALFNPYETPVPTPYSEGAFYTQLFDGLLPVGTSQQITTGIPYSFNGLETGKSYTMRVWEQTTDNLVGSTWTWNNYGGVTALDALIVSYMGIQNPVLSTFPWISPDGMEGYTPFFNQVADANNSTTITSLDALMLLYRSVNNPLTIPFPGGRHNFQIAGKKMNGIDELVYPNAPDILFNPSGTYAATSDVSSVYYEAALPEIESGTTVFNMYLVATGDVNVSYDVLNQTKLKSAISFEGVTARKVNDELIIPVRLKQNAELAAASISISYKPDVLEVVDIIGIDIYTIDSEKGTVKIAWMDENGKPFNENDEFFALKIKILKDIKEGTSYLELLSGTEFSDKSATVLNDIVLKANYIETSPRTVLDSKRELLHSIFPNPFRDLTTIQYTLPASGHVKVNVFNYLGQEVKLLVNEHQLQGTHNLMLNNDDLKGAGTYIYQITFESKDQLIVERGTIMLAK